MDLTRRSLVNAAAGAAVVVPLGRKAHAQSATPSNTIRIGLLSDLAGPFRDISGPNGVACVRQAVQDFGSRGFAVEVVTADHQNRPDVASNIARQWFDRDGADAIVEVVSSAPALAVNGIARERNKVVIHNTAAVAGLTGAQCTPNTVHWSHDTWMLARSAGGAMVQAGCYAGTLHDLKAVADMGVPAEDDAFGQGRMREDGRKLHPSDLFEVKKPEESTGPWDYSKLLQTTPGDQAFRPLAEGGCAFVRG